MSGWLDSDVHTRNLSSADPLHGTVATIAHRWGFTHLGRFAAAHKTVYGETPLQALRAPADLTKRKGR
jgi:AraC-like DNA-binding protein